MFTINMSHKTCLSSSDIYSIILFHSNSNQSFQGSKHPYMRFLSECLRVLRVDFLIAWPNGSIWM